MTELASSDVGGGYVPPHSIEAEEAVLGAMLLSERTHYEYVIEEQLKPEDFYRERHRVIFQAMFDLFAQSVEIDVVTVIDHLRATGKLEAAGGDAEIDALTASVPVVPHIRRYAKIVRENALLRRVLAATYQIQSSVHNHEADPEEIVERAEKAMLEVARDDRQKDFRAIGKVLDHELERWQKLSDEGLSVTGTPSGFHDLDDITGGFQPGALIIIAARPAMGKCTSFRCIVRDALSGELMTVGEAAHRVENGDEVVLASLGRDLKLRATRVTAAFRNGVKPVFRLRTKLGREITATANHPLLTIKGWRRLDELAPGSRVAVPRSIPAHPEPKLMPDGELVLLAERVLGDPDNAKSVPPAVLGLGEAQIARFLGVLWACDGHIHANERLRQAGYTTISEQLAKDVQHLLLRLGIVSKIRTLKRPVYDGTDKVAREVLITGRRDLERFIRRIDVPGKLPQMARLALGLNGLGQHTNVDTLPVEAWELVAEAKGERSWAEISRAAGYPSTHNWHVSRRGLTRDRAAQFSRLLDSEAMRELAESDVWWDEVVSIAPAGEEETFDLTIPGDHNFVAGDVIVHNSALVTNIAENVSLHAERPRPVALFSLEMAEAELAQRFIASQASIKGDDLRKGRLRDERKWKRVLETAARYDAAPLFVDDSSDVSLMDVRAKARRLHQQTYEQYGGLGLIVVDYLQLLRADARIESRVLQIGEMSRGLKILARELEVPVIALSQLSRGVESRTDKRPMLSDLRESGSIEQDADLVAFIYRDEYYNENTDSPGEAELIIAKHRQGATDTVRLTFQGEYPRFMSIQRAA